MDNKRKIVFGPDVSFAGSEAYKLLRTNLMFALPTGKKCQMIGVTSSMRGEGKSTTALNLAYTIAQNGEKVLLVDADMRLPSIYQKLAGDIPPNPSELLNSKNMDKYLEMWAYYFDYIIFDFPPVGVVTDALVMAEKLDGMIVVVRQNYCLQPTLDDTITKLRYVKANILGIVMTMADSQDKQYKKYYSKYKKNYEYGYGYEYRQRAIKQPKKKALKSGKE